MGAPGFVCQLCGSKDTPFVVLDLGLQPICNAFLTAKELSQAEEKYPLKMVLCNRCRLAQLADRIPEQAVFGPNFNYLSGSSKALLRYFRNFSETEVRRFDLGGRSVCDVGSNDGSLLSYFKRAGCTVVGVEPTPLPAKQAYAIGVTTIQAYFTESVATTIVRKFGTMKLVTAMNVVAHASEIESFLNGVRRLMGRDGTFASQSHYLPFLIERLEYDTIYHEHLRYYTLATLRNLFGRFGLTVFDAETNEIYGGSILVHASTRTRPPSEGMIRLLKKESRFLELPVYKAFRKEVEGNSRRLRALLVGLRRKGKTIVGIGAPMKSSTLLNYCHLGPDLIAYLTEVNPLKIGTFSPGVHIPVVPDERILEDSPDYAVLLSWNMAEDIIQKFRDKGYGGKFIIPVPRPRVARSQGLARTPK